MDFNVHPAKTMVRFANPQKIHNLIFKVAEQKHISTSSMVAEESSHWEVIPVSNEQIPIFLTEPVFNREPEFLTLGNSIVVIKETDGVIFLDYHAAHERINFEKKF